MGFCYISFLVDTRLLRKQFIILNMNGFFLHALHRSSSQNSTLSRGLDIITRANISFICQGLGNFWKSALVFF